MSTQGSPGHLAPPMPDSARSRSDSLEESASQQDRKRPRLSSNDPEADQLSPEHALTDSGDPARVDPSFANMTETGNDETSSTAHQDESGPVAPASTGVPSKVTINTRNVQTPSSSQHPTSPPKSPDASENTDGLAVKSQMSGTTEDATEMTITHTEPISVLSSPNRSPEIQVAELEDIDYPSTDTRWTPLNRTSGYVNRQELLTPRYVFQTFPYARSNTAFGSVHELVPQISKIFQNGSAEDGKLFGEVNQWLTNFLLNAIELKKPFLRAEATFWNDFPDLVAGLLRRHVEPPQQAKPSDLEDFFVHYGELTQLFVQYDVHRLQSLLDEQILDTEFELVSKHYLPVLNWILQYREIPFYDVLRLHLTYNPANLVSSVIDRLAASPYAIIESLAKLANLLAPFLPKRLSWTPTFIQILTAVFHFVKSIPERTIFGADEKFRISPQLSPLMDKAVNFFIEVDRILHLAITKQLPWLTIDNSPDFLRIISNVFSCVGAQDIDLGYRALNQTGVDTSVIARGDLPGIIGLAWKFKTLRKYITVGRMELRVYGMEAMQMDLVHVWRCHIQYNPDSAGVPLVQYLIRFIQESKLVEYIVGVDSHPQLIGRSSNVIGFLCVTNTFSPEDSDTIWRTINQSQDPRTVAEVLNILKSILQMSQLSTLIYLCGKVLELPVHRLDSRMLELIGDLNQHIQQKSHPGLLREDPVDPLPFRLCVQILREASASTICSSEQKNGLQQFATEQLSSLLRMSRISEDEQTKLWDICVQDVAENNSCATGSIHALNAWISSNPMVVVHKLAALFNITQLLIENLAQVADATSSTLSDIAGASNEFSARLEILSFLIDNVPASLTEDLRELLWTSLLTSPNTNAIAQASCWDVLTKVANVRRSHRNTFLDHIIEEFLPRLIPEQFNIKVLEFVKASVMYEIRFFGVIDPNENDVVSIPGMDRVWRVVLHAPNGTVEAAATEFIISQYLDSLVITQRAKHVIEATHLSLIDQCVQQVISAAKSLKSFTDGTTSGEDETMAVEPLVIIASEAEIRSKELQFERSLLFLKQLLQGIRSRPRYSPPPVRPAELPRKPFPDRGAIIHLSYQAFGGRMTNSWLQKISIGDLNTGDELAQYLAELTGFTQFTCISAGHKVELAGNSGPLCDLRIGLGLLIVKKVADTPERTAAGHGRASSPVDRKITDHFAELYDLLNLEERLAKEVFSFLDLFPAQERARDLIQGMDGSIDEVLPVDKPYKLLYCAKALRSCIEDESFSTVPNVDFLRYCVRIVIETFGRQTSMHNDDIIDLRIAHLLIECLVLALRVHVPAEISSVYITNPERYTEYLLGMLEKARGMPAAEGSIPEIHIFVRDFFMVLSEGTLHHPQIWEDLQKDDRFGRLLEQRLLEDARLDVRKAVAGVIFGLTGSSGSKIFLKIQDPRSPRARFPSANVDDSLAKWWSYLVELVPKATSQPLRCQQLLEVSDAVVRCVGKSREPEELKSLFQTWSELLVGYNYVEVIGRSSEDYVMLGVTKLVSNCYHFLQPTNQDLLSSQLAQNLVSLYLFPKLSEWEDSEVQPRIPVLNEAIREDLYDLVLILSKTQDDFEIIIDHLQDIVPRDHYFDIHLQNDRQALRSEVGYAGLKNLSNTCYLNSLFAQLFMNLQFRGFMLNASLTARSSQALVTEMAKVFAHMQNFCGKFVDPQDAVETIRTYDNEQIDVCVQMDVDEFFNLLFDRLEAQLPDSDARRNFKSIYGGQLVQQIKSRECEHISERLEPFSAIQCEIKGKISLEDSLRAYVEGEVMQGDNKYSCTGCGRHVEAVKRACLKDVPDHLIFNLKRFDFDITTMTRCKINDEFQFPDFIDMAPYTSKHLSDPDQHVDQDVFELVGVLVHSGTAESGHYYSYIRERPSSRPAKDSWVQFNDTEVNTFDPARIGDCCFGGVDMSSALQFPKGYNAYMLFYQRKASIERFESQYNQHDQDNPVRLPLQPTLEQFLFQQNELYLRSYCAQDRSHAKFVRLLLERMRWGENRQLCSDGHEIESRTLAMVLEYVQQISCRFKDLPEFETTVKIVREYCTQCPECDSVVNNWYLRDNNFRDTVLRNPQPVVRKAFGALCLEALRSFKASSKAAGLSEQQSKLQSRRYKSDVQKTVEMLEDQWDDIHKFGRGWNDYFDLLASITNFGVFEAYQVLQSMFLEKVMEIVWVEGRGDPKKLKRKYPAYVAMREKGRLFSHTGLLNFLAALLNRVNLATNPLPGGERERLKSMYTMVESEARLLVPAVPSRGGSYRYEWLKRIIAPRTSQVALEAIIASLVQQEEEVIQIVFNTLTSGLEAQEIPNAVAYLEPTLAFCAHATSGPLINHIVEEALDSVDTIYQQCGKDYYDFVTQLMKTENLHLDWDQRHFTNFVLLRSQSWAPSLLLIPDNSLHYDISSETLELLNQMLLAPLESPHTLDEDKTMLRNCARHLVVGAIKHIKAHYATTGSEAVTQLDVGQANHLDQVVMHILQNCFNKDDEGDARIWQEAVDAIHSLQVRSQVDVPIELEADVGAAGSESWADPDEGSVAGSESSVAGVEEIGGPDDGGV